MDTDSAPQQEQPSPGTGLFSEQGHQIYAATFTCVTALILFATYFIAITRFRLWHSNWILAKILLLVENPLISLIGICATVLTTVDYTNHLYIIWLAVLNNAYDHVITISADPRYSWFIREYIALFYNIYLAVIMFRNRDAYNYIYDNPLTVLWAFLLAKLTVRIVSSIGMNRSYGLNNTKLVSDYMKIEHNLVTPNEISDPTNMRGYKYLVMGEGKIDGKFRLIEQSEYTADVELPESVVTVEKVWSCNKGILDPSLDEDNKIKDICLSFAFFKLSKRRFCEYPAAEAQQEKTRQLVNGLLSSRNTDRVYRVICSELSFLRDFFYTRYPVIFAFGFPVFNVILVFGTFGVCVWISYTAFLRLEATGDSYLISRHHNHNIDYTITNILLVMITVMEAFETLLYVVSDWAKVLLICRYVRRRSSHRICFYDKVFALYCKLKFSRSVNRTLGQFSLLKNYNRNYLRWLPVNCFLQPPWGSSPARVAPFGMTEDMEVALSDQVKGAVLNSLRLMNGHPTNGVSSLKRNGVYEDLAWTCALKTEFETLIVWHIATGLCGFSKNSIKPHQSVANDLSNYCSYLMVFLPNMLPESIFSVQLFFREILSEMKEFFHEAVSSEEKYNLMMRADVSGNQVIEKAVRLGKYLLNISDDSRRWKIIADFWSEFIIFLAPSGKIEEHFKNLESGGEFITHLWTLLYHAGITVDRTATASDGYYP